MRKIQATHAPTTFQAEFSSFLKNGECTMQNYQMRLQLNWALQ
jgi:hypothetical protein